MEKLLTTKDKEILEEGGIITKKRNRCTANFSKPTMQARWLLDSTFNMWEQLPT